MNIDNQKELNLIINLWYISDKTNSDKILQYLFSLDSNMNFNKVKNNSLAILGNVKILSDEIDKDTVIGEIHNLNRLTLNVNINYDRKLIDIDLFLMSLEDKIKIDCYNGNNYIRKIEIISENGRQSSAIV